MEHNEIELYPDEQNRVIEVLTTIQRRWTGRPDTSENLQAMASEAEQRLESIGFKAIVSFENLSLAPDLNYYRTPEVTIIDRVKTETEHDYERHAFEVQSGFLDGKVGVMGNDGKLKEPSRKLILPN